MGLDNLTSLFVYNDLCNLNCYESVGVVVNTFILSLVNYDKPVYLNHFYLRIEIAIICAHKNVVNDSFSSSS